MTALRDRIVQEYTRRGDTLGWRLLSSPATTMDDARVAFIGLNPGGNVAPPDHADFAMDHGSAYVRERWAGAPPGESRLQRQVRALFKRLDVEPDQVLAGNLVPFRSPDWASLADPDSALRFGEDIWRELLRTAAPQIIVTMGRKVIAPIERITGIAANTRVPVGWGNITARFGHDSARKLICLPHLSRFPIITRSQSAEAMHRLFGP